MVVWEGSRTDENGDMCDLRWERGVIYRGVLGGLGHFRDLVWEGCVTMVLERVV
jgi:hypothetical protein